MPRLPLSSALVLLAACATSPEPNDSKPQTSRPAAAPAADARPAPLAAADGGAAEAEASRPAYDPNQGMEMTTISEREWVAKIREKVARRQAVDPAQLRFSPARTLLVYLRTTGGPPPAPADSEDRGAPKSRAGNGKSPEKSAKRARPGRKKIARRPPPRRHQIVVVDTEGRRRGVFRPIQARGSDEPPGDLRFLAEDRLVYEVLAPPEAPLASPAPAGRRAPARRGRGRGAARRSPRGAPERALEPAKKAQPRVVAEAAALPRRLFVIQPVEGRPRPIRCSGVRFTFTAGKERLAFVGGAPEAAFVAVDGVQVYPRRGRTIVASDLAWSKDGRSLAFLEASEQAPARLVLLAEFDNASGDTTWNLPTAASVEGARVFWSGPGKLVVGKTMLGPVFATSFTREVQKELPRDP